MTIASHILTRYISSSCLLLVSFITSLKTVRFMFGIVLIFFDCQAGRQNENIISLLSAHARSGWIQSQSTVKQQTCLPIHVQNITFNLIRLFLDHKLIRQTDGQTWTNCLTPLSLHIITLWELSWWRIVQTKSDIIVNILFAISPKSRLFFCN